MRKPNSYELARELEASSRRKRMRANWHTHNQQGRLQTTRPLAPLAPCQALLPPRNLWEVVDPRRTLRDLYEIVMGKLEFPLKGPESMKTTLLALLALSMAQ